MMAAELAPRAAAAVYLAGLNGRSQRTMLKALHCLVQLAAGADPRGVRATEDEQQRQVLAFPWSSLRYEHTNALRARLQELYTPAGANKMLSALRGVLKASWRLGQLSAAGYQDACDVPAVRGSRVLRGRALDAGEIVALFAACARDRGVAGRRDAALFGLLCAGLRRTELVTLPLDAYQDGAVRVLGKGNKERQVPLPAGSRAALDAWLQARGDAPGPLLLAVAKGGRIHHRELDDQAVLYRCRFRARQAGINRPFSPHDFRRTCAGDLLDRGVDLVVVQQLLGHASIATTAIYDRRGERAKARAVELLHVPFVPPAE